jgi:hypothetical protein
MTIETLNPDFLDFISLLEKKSVEYLVVGFHGFPRYTGDMDFFVAVNEINAERLLEVIEEFGFASMGLQKQDFLTPSFVIEIGREPRKIQILTGIDGVTFEECRESAVEYDYCGTICRFIGLEALIRNKKSSGRPKDLIDVQSLTGQ